MIVANIEKILSPAFFDLGIEVVGDFLAKCDIIGGNVLNKIIEYGFKRYGDKAVLLLRNLKCGQLELIDIENIFQILDYIPIIHEANRILHDLQMKQNNTQKESNKVIMKDEEERYLDVDWKAEYENLRRNKEALEDVLIAKDKEFSIMKKLPFSFDIGERKLTEGEVYMLTKIINERNINKAIEIISETPCMLFATKSNGEGFLQMSAKGKWKEGIELILNQLFMVVELINKKNEFENEMLMTSCEDGHLDIIEYLVSKGANISEKNNKGCTPLMEASGNGHLNVVEYLVSNGANISEKDDDGWTSLMYASGNGHLNVVEYLVSKGANLNEKDDDGCTSLMYASGNGHLNVVEYLVSKGANLNEKDNCGWTPLMEASGNGHLNVAYYLVSKGANINEKDNCGWTSLMYASGNGHLNVVDYLASKGAND